MARKRAALMHVLAGDGSRPAIVYCGTRKDTESVCRADRGQAGSPPGTYHAGMSPAARADSQAAFMDGRTEVIVATNAFGMGVDKADVSHRRALGAADEPRVLLPGGGPGRARRASRPGRCCSPPAMDLGRLIRFIKERETSVDDVKRFVASLRADPTTARCPPARGARRTLTGAAVDRRAGGGRRARPRDARWAAGDAHRAGKHAGGQVAIRIARNRVWEAYHSIERYSSASGVCRRRQILEHFGGSRGRVPGRPLLRRVRPR